MKQILRDGGTWHQFTTDAALAQAIFNGAEDLGLRVALRQVEGDSGGAAAWQVEVEGTRAQLRALVGRGRGQMRYLQVWQFFGAAPNSRVAWRAHFCEWISRTWHQTQAPDLATLYSAARKGKGFDLDSARTFSYWLDYLGEYEERRAAWCAFEAAHGTCNTL